MPVVTCPACGEDERLSGERLERRARLVCGACGHRWERDLSPRCRLCGSRNVAAVPTSTLEEAGRGDQRTPSGIRDVHHCLDCGARDATSSNPSPAPEGWSRRDPAPAGRRAGRLAVDDESGPRARIVNSVFGTFAEGEVVGERWRIDRLLRWSSSGSVWLASEVDGERRVTFKLVHPALTKDEETANLHARSARAALPLSHAHLLRVLDVRARHRHVLVVAEAFPGDRLAEHVPLEGDLLARSAAGLSDALAEMHAQRVVHLDIRPGKVLLGSDGHAKLVDFGTGRLRAATSAAPRLPDPTAWRAPEQIVGGQHGPAADVYGLGFTLWFAAGGDLAALGDSSADRARNRLRADLPPLGGGLPRRVVEAIAAATRTDPAERPTAAELAEALSR